MQVSGPETGRIGRPYQFFTVGGPIETERMEIGWHWFGYGYGNWCSLNSTSDFLINWFFIGHGHGDWYWNGHSVNVPLWWMPPVLLRFSQLWDLVSLRGPKGNWRDRFQTKRLQNWWLGQISQSRLGEGKVTQFSFDPLNVVAYISHWAAGVNSQKRPHFEGDYRNWWLTHALLGAIQLAASRSNMITYLQLQRDTNKFHIVFTRGQFWPSGIVVASVCLSVCLCVRQSLACPRDNLSPVQARITKFGPEEQNTLVKIPIVLGVNWPWTSRSNLT